MGSVQRCTATKDFVLSTNVRIDLLTSYWYKKGESQPYDLLITLFMTEIDRPAPKWQEVQKLSFLEASFIQLPHLDDYILSSWWDNGPANSAM